jgi:protein phosphatase
VVGVVTVLAVLVAGSLAVWTWVQHQYFVGASNGAVAIFRGLPESVGPVHLAWVDSVADDVRVSDLPGYAQEKVTHGMPADDRPAAEIILANLRQQAHDCRAAAEGPLASPTGSPTTSPTGSPSASVTAAAPTASVTPGTPPPSAASTVGSPAVAVNPQATGLTSTSTSVTATPLADCGGLSR